jgi:hypothetical protein
MQHEIVVCGAPFGTPDEKDALKRCKDAGVTSVQIYTFWNKFEPDKKGVFDWAHYDKQVEALQLAGLKYVPFILIGPKYAAPKWRLESTEHKGLRCLEHGKESPIESIWNPQFRQEISRVIKSFAGHYLPMNVIESFQPGICGDYGEAIFPVLGNWPGDYHTHAGWWCGDDDAKTGFRQWLLTKYKDVRSLNEAWRSVYLSIDDISPFLPHKTPSRTAYFDMVDWYRDSMTEFSEFWMKESRKHFPDTKIYLCTGGCEEAKHGSLFSDQAKVCAKHGAGIRLTNECNKFYDNFFVTAYTKSACDHYGAYYGLEPVGPSTERGVVARLFGSAAYGNNQIFYYYGNLFPDKEAKPAAHVKKYNHMIQQRPLPESVAFFWPGYAAALAGLMTPDIRSLLTFIRTRRSCMPVNEQMILDNALTKYKLLVIPTQTFTKRGVLLKIVDWVNAGGTLFAYGLMRDLELELVDQYSNLFGITKDSSEEWGHTPHIINPDDNFPEFSKIKSYHHSISWTGLDKDVKLLTHTLSGPAVQFTVTTGATSTAFYKKNGKGTAVFYCGPVMLVEDKEALFDEPKVFTAILNDVINKYSGVIDLTPDTNAGEIARAEIDGSVYALKELEIVKIK